MLDFRMAWRNLWRQKRRTWLTALAMVFSNVLLIFMISLQFGSYDMMINNTLQAFGGHIQVQHAGYQDNPRMRDSVPDIVARAAHLREDLPNAGIASRAMAFALASSEERSFGIQVVGVEPDHEPLVSTLPGLMGEGRYLQSLDAGEIVIGSVLARNLKAGLGDELTLVGSGRDGSFAANVATIVGIIDSGMPDLDRSMAQVGLTWFQDTFFMEGHGHAIVVALPDLGEVELALPLVAKSLENDPELRALDWEALNPGLKQAIQADFTSAWFMYGVLIVLVAFSVLNTQLMSVLERTREFGVIMALGITPRNLASLVILETGLMALLGLVIGVGLGALVAAWFNTHGFSYPGMEELAARFNMPDRMYPSITPITLMMGPGVVFLFSVLASVYPALRLFRLHPVQAMRAA